MIFAEKQLKDGHNLKSKVICKDIEDIDAVPLVQQELLELENDENKEVIHVMVKDFSAEAAFEAIEALTGIDMIDTPKNPFLAAPQPLLQNANLDFGSIGTFEK